MSLSEPKEMYNQMQGSTQMLNLKNIQISAENYMGNVDISHL
jgi:hypothetical protein